MRKKRNLAILVGNNIAQKRHACNLSQFELALELNIGADSLSRIETGVVAPRYNRLEEIAEILKCSVAEFFYSSDDPIHIKLYAVADKLKNLPEEKQDEYVILFKKILELAG